MDDAAPPLAWSEFTRVDMRAGTILTAEVFAQARRPAYRITIDFGALGVRTSSAQLTALYTPETLVGRQVIAVVNFPPKQIANLMSECLVLGTEGEGGVVTLLAPERGVGDGERVG